jgi:hypothetical protein
MKMNYHSTATGKRRRKVTRVIESPPHVAVAPGLLELDHAPLREADDTDIDFEARKRLVEAAMRFARTG